MDEYNDLGIYKVGDRLIWKNSHIARDKRLTIDKSYIIFRIENRCCMIENDEGDFKKFDQVYTTASHAVMVHHTYFDCKRITRLAKLEKLNEKETV